MVVFTELVQGLVLMMEQEEVSLVEVVSVVVVVEVVVVVPVLVAVVAPEVAPVVTRR